MENNLNNNVPSLKRQNGFRFRKTLDLSDENVDHWLEYFSGDNLNVQREFMKKILQELKDEAEELPPKTPKNNK